MDSTKIISYNSTGLADEKLCYIQSLVNNYSPQIICLQETWQLDDTAYTKLNKLKDFICVHKSSIRDNKLLVGRPYGGLAVLWHKDIACHVSVINCTSKYIIPVALQCENKKYILINCYLPNDIYSQTYVSNDFLSAVDDIDMEIQRNDNFNGIIIAGDLNVDFRRDNSHTRHINGMLLTHGLVSTWDGNSNVATYQNWASPNQSSCIDHFLVSAHLHTTPASCYQEPLNPSNHNAITITMRGMLTKNNIDAPNHHDLNSISWRRITQNQLCAYINKLSSYVNLIETPGALICNNVHCISTNHKKDINTFTSCITDACIKAAVECLPAKRNKKFNKPYWSAEAHEHKQKCLFWGKMWKDNGCPRTGQVYATFCHVKRQYHYAVRRINRRDKWLRRQRLAENLCTNSHRDMWSEVKLMDSSKTPVAPCVDGNTDSEKIAETFADKYERIYTSFSDVEALTDIELKINQTVDRQPIVTYTQCEVKSAINSLKSGKSDGSKGLFSDHIKLGCSVLVKPLTWLINSMLIHGYSPQEILISNVISIPKGQLDRSTTKNYRGIALASCLSKLIDLLIISKYKDCLYTSDNQFSYKNDHSTTMCTIVAKETIRYYLNNSTPVYACLLDASKAFDLVRHGILFQMLLDRGIPGIVIRLVMDIYRRQTMFCSWLGRRSRQFTATNGVRQGAILSSHCFNIYIDTLLQMLESSGIGCWLGRKYLGALAYADDVILMCPSSVGLQKMLHICEEYATQHSLTFNTSKTVCVKFCHNQQTTGLPNVKLCGNTLEWKSTVTHLGSDIECDLSDRADILQRRNKLFAGSNIVKAKFNVAPTWMQSALYCAYNTHFYGCTAWDLQSKYVDTFFTAWNRCIRCIWGVPANTHTSIVHQLTLSPRSEIMKRKRKLKTTMLCSSNKLVSYVTERFKDDKRYIIGNIDNACNDCIFDDNWKITLLLELINCRDGIKIVENLDSEEIVSIINDICTA